MTPIDPFDRTLERWLSEKAVPIGPAGARDSAMRTVRRSRQRPGWLVALGGRSFGGGAPSVDRATFRIGLALAAALVFGLLVGAVALTGSRPALVVTTPSDPAPLTASLLQMRSSHSFPTLVALPDGRVLIIGYCASGGTAAETWDPTRDPAGGGRFDDAGSLLAGSMLARWCPTAAIVLRDGRVFVLGVVMAMSDGVTSPDAEVWDPATLTFSPAGTPADTHGGARLTLQPDGSVLVAGPVESGDVTVERWDPATRQFSHVNDRPPGRWYGQYVAILPDGREFHLDQIDNGLPPDGKAFLWDPATGMDVPAGQMRSPRVGATMTALPDGRVLVAGGYVPKADGSAVAVATVEIWDPATGQFSLSAPLLVARKDHAGVVLDDQHVFLAGADRYSNQSNTAEIYAVP